MAESGIDHKINIVPAKKFPVIRHRLTAVLFLRPSAAVHQLIDNRRDGKAVGICEQVLPMDIPSASALSNDCDS